MEKKKITFKTPYSFQGCVCVHTQHTYSPASNMDQELLN